MQCVRRRLGGILIKADCHLTPTYRILFAMDQSRIAPDHKMVAEREACWQWSDYTAKITVKSQKVKDWKKSI